MKRSFNLTDIYSKDTVTVTCISRFKNESR